MIMIMDIQTALEKKKKLLITDKEYKRHENLLHRRIVGRYIGDFVYGANDGVVTTFAIVAGVSGASLPNLAIIILGLANILADGISMGASNFLGRKSEADFARAQQQKENWEIDNLRELEIEEVREIYKNKGFKGQDLDRAVRIITSDRKVWVDTMMKDELGLIPQENNNRPLKHGLVTFSSFVFAGFIPLFPFFIPLSNAFLVSSVLGAVTLFTIGALRSLIATVGAFRGGIEMLLVGGTAAAVAYAIGFVISRLL